MASASETNNRLVIFRGDDTGGAFGRSLVFTIRTDGGASLDGCRAEWEFDGIVKRFDAPLIDGETREIFYSHNETRCMRLGVRFGTLRIIDAAGKVRTFNNTKPVEVTDIVSRVYPGSSAATVTISAGVTWDGIAGKPKLVKTINGEGPDDDGNIEVASGGTVKSATVNGGEKVMPDASGNLALTVEIVPSDYDDVRTNAETGAAHAAKRGSGSVTDANPHGTRIQDIDFLGSELTNLGSGLASASAVATDARNIALGHKYDTTNPHATTAEQVGFRVVELVVEGDAKKLYLMLNGERTTERVTSYAALLAMAKRGLVRLYYNAVGGTGRKALYTAHMVDDNGTPAMRFDATGTLGEKVYTRSIALTKSGTDGIAVTIGDLTEIQKSLTAAQLANIDDVPNKRDKTDIEFGYVAIKPGVGTWAQTDSERGVDTMVWVEAFDGWVPERASVAILRAGDGWNVVDADNVEFHKTLSPKFTHKFVRDGKQVSATLEYSEAAEDHSLTHTKETRGLAKIGQDGNLEAADANDIVNTEVFATPAFAEAAFGEAATSETAIPNGGVADITKASGTINVTFADPKGDELRYCELIVRGVSADNAVSVSLPDGMDALYAEGVASKAGINKYIFAEHARGHWQVSRVTLTATIS